MSDLPNKENLRVDEVADYFRLSQSWVFARCADYTDTGGEQGLRHMKLSGAIRIKRAWVLEFEKRSDPRIPKPQGQMNLFPVGGAVGALSRPDGGDVDTE